MTDFLTISSSSAKSVSKQRRWQHYLLAGIIANTAFWASALLYLQLVPPTYTSRSAVTLPGAGSAANVNLPGIGQASYESSSPYASSTQDPREDYKFVALSESVLKAAATKLDMPLEEFGKPRIKIVDSTTIMQVDFKGASPEEAQGKSLAFYQAFESKLNELRREEIIRRDAGFQAGLSTSQKKLEVAQKRLSDYKARSGLNSSDQIRDLSINIEQLRREQAQTIAQQEQSSSRLKQLSANLNLSGQQAADAFVIQTDQILQQNLKDYSEATANLDVLTSKFLPNYPAVVAEKAKQNSSKAALLNRSQSLLGRPVSEADLRQFNLSSTSGSARETLFQQLITVKADQQGLQAQAQAINQQITLLQNRLKNLSQQESTLDALKRDMQVAEAVFSSTLTRLDIGKSNVFGSYPLVQILTNPTLPETPSWPVDGIVFLGAGLGSLFITTGLVLLWLREQKNELTEKPAHTQTKIREYETSEL